MKGTAAITAFALLFMLGVPTAAGAGKTTSTVRVPRVAPAGPGRLGLYVSVTDADHRAVTGLTSASFSFLLENTPMETTSASTLASLGEGLAITLLVDSSDSLPLSEIELRDVAASFVNKRKPGDVLSVATLDDAARGEVRPWTAEGPQLQAWVQGIGQTNTTLLYEAMGKGLERLAGTRDVPSMRAILVLTDGVDFGSRDPWTYDSVRATAKEAGIPVFSVWYPSTDRKSRTQGLEVMQTLAGTTAGQVHMASSEDGAIAGKEQIERAFDDFHSTAHGIYVVEVTSGALALGRYTGQLQVVGAPPIRFSFELAAPVPPPVAPPTTESSPEPTDGNGDADDELSVWVWIGAAGALVVILVLVMLALARDNAPDPEPEAQTRRPVREPAKMVPTRRDDRSPTVGLGDEHPVSEPAGADDGISDWGLPTLSEGDPFASGPSPQASATPLPAQSRSKKTMVMMGEAVWWLTVQSGPEAGQRQPIGSGGPVIVGAAPDADIRLSEGTVSGLHAQLRPIAGGIEVTDLGSTNGTFVNGVLQPHPFILTHGQVFACGRCELHVGQE